MFSLGTPGLGSSPHSPHGKRPGAGVTVVRGKAVAHPQRKGESRGEGGTVRALALASTALCLGLHALGVEGCGPLTEQHISRLLPQGSTQIHLLSQVILELHPTIKIEFP